MGCPSFVPARYCAKSDLPPWRLQMAETQAQRQERQRADELTYWKRQHAELVKEMEAQQAQVRRLG